jgi:hypothetical protein
MVPALLISGLAALFSWSIERDVRRSRTREQLSADPIMWGYLFALPVAILMTALFAVLLVVYVVRWVTSGEPPP